MFGLFFTATVTVFASVVKRHWSLSKHFICFHSRIHPGDRICSSSSTPPSCCLPFHLLPRPVYNTLRGSELIAMRGCVCGGVSSRARRNAAVTSSCLLHGSERGRRGGGGGGGDTSRFMRSFFSPSVSFIPSGFPSSETSCLFYGNEFGIGKVAKASKRGKSSRSSRELHQQISTPAPLAYLHASTPQTSNKGRPATRQLGAQQLGGNETQKMTSSVTFTDAG